MVPRAQFTASPLRSVAPVICAVCGSNAHCIRRVPDAHGRRIEYRAFECSVCHRRSYLNASLAPQASLAPNDNLAPSDIAASVQAASIQAASVQVDIEEEVERLIRRANPKQNPEPNPYPYPEP